MDIATERETVRQMMAKELVKGESWYLMGSTWFKTWKTWVGFDPSDQNSVGIDHPGPIDNSPLFKDTYTLKEHLIDILDYVLLPSDCWNLFLRNYGITDEEMVAERKCIVKEGMFVKHLHIEVYLMDINLQEYSKPEEGFVRCFSRVDTIETVANTMAELFDIPNDKEIRLWNKYMSNTYDHLSYMDYTLQEAGLYNGQVIILEQRNDDGSWPRSDTSPGYKVSRKEKAQQKVVKKDTGKMKKKTENRQHSSPETKSQQPVSESETDASQAVDLVTCDTCRNSVKVYCKSCHLRICDDCLTTHVMQTSNTGHEIVKYTERRHHQRLPSCSNHQMKCELCCIQCKHPVCSSCLTGTSHKNHDFLGMSQLLNAQKKYISNEINEVSSITDRLQSGLKEINQIPEEINKRYDEIQSQIKAAGDTWRKALDAIICKRSKEVEELRKNALDSVLEHRNTFEISLENAKTIHAEYNKIVEDQDPEDIFNFQTKNKDQRKIPSVPTITDGLPCFKPGKIPEKIETDFGVVEVSDRSNIPGLQYTIPARQNEYPAIQEILENPGVLTSDN